jgi:lipid-A-disaccharide synthase
MLMAGEASGDALGMELIEAMRVEKGELDVFGAGGMQMKSAGVDVEIDLTEHAVVGIWEAVRHYGKFKRFFNRLLNLAMEKQPDAIVCIDNPGFNLRFVRAIRERSSKTDWRPKIIYYISPQLWAWHESRVHQIERDVDLLLSIFPFEKEWYSKRAPGFPVEFVGHPLCDRYPDMDFNDPQQMSMPPKLLLLPGSRAKEVGRHLRVMVDAAKRIDAVPLIVLPNNSLVAQAKLHVPEISDWDIKVGGLPEALADSDLAIASSGTVTLECAWFRVPTVVLYKTSWITYFLGKLFLKVNHIAMPNLLAGREVFPEYIQRDASAENLAREADRFIHDSTRREQLCNQLGEIADSLGGKGAAERASKAVWRLVDDSIRI